MSKEAWLITGGAGFIGSHFVELVARRKSGELDKIVVLDALTYAGNLQNLESLLSSGKVEFVKGDICDASLVDSLFEKYGFTKVIHFAAESHVDRSISGPAQFLKTNIEGTFTLLEAARSSWKNELGKESSQNLFLHISTDEVYGSLSAEDPPFCETSPVQPNSPYSASKAASDHLVRAWFHTYGLPAIISNCSNNFGPRQFPEKLIPLIILNALEGKSLPVYGNGRQIRDWLHVEDHCEALLRILARGKKGEVYLIGGNNQKPNIEVVELICDEVDAIAMRPPGTTRKQIQYVADRPGHDQRYAIDATKLKTELGWQPKYRLDSSVRDLILWYMNSQEWCNAVRTGEYMKYYQNQYGLG